jgi:hypothetical protein
VHFDTNADTVARAQFTDVATGTTTTVFTFPPQYQRVQGNQSFDELSRDGRWLAGMVQRDDGEGVIFALNLETGTLGATLPIDELYQNRCTPDPTWGNVWPDWVGVSPLGNYLVVQWVRDATTPCSGLETYDLQTGAFIGRVQAGHPHGDLGYAPGVGEYFFTEEPAGPPPYNGNPALSYRLLPGTSTVSLPNYVIVDLTWADGSHFSARGPAGLTLVSMGGWDDGVWRRFEQELYLVDLAGGVARLAHHHSSACGYWVQPRATVSADGRYVCFASDWTLGTGTSSCTGPGDLGHGDAYVIDLCGDCPGDVNCDKLVDAADGLLVMEGLGVGVRWKAGDITEDDRTNLNDIAVVQVQLGTQCN